MQKFFTNFYNGLSNQVGSLFKGFLPQSAFSWQTLMFLSLFSWLMSGLATGLVEIFLANLSWIFLILGVYWWTTSTKFLRIGDVPLSPWITGAIISLYIFAIIREFRLLFGQGSVTPLIAPKVIIIWPLVSAVIAALPACLDENFKLKIPPKEKRQNLVLLVTSQIVLSCWFQFYFVVQTWLVQYPTIQSDNVQQSAFVTEIGLPYFSRPSSSVVRSPRGVLILESTTSKLKDIFNGKPWSEVERNLLPQQRTQLFQQITETVKQEIASRQIKEDDFWEIQYQDPTARGTAYSLQLQAIWLGPRSKAEPYTLSQSCQITPVNTKVDDQTMVISRATCQPVTGWGVNNQFVMIQ